MIAKSKDILYLCEDELNELLLRGECDYYDYVTHHSEEWMTEFVRFCKEHRFLPANDSAAQFYNYKNEQLENAFITGDV